MNLEVHLSLQEQRQNNNIEKRCTTSYLSDKMNMAGVQHP